jgi:hypothetical protein
MLVKKATIVAEQLVHVSMSASCRARAKAIVSYYQMLPAMAAHARSSRRGQI